LNPPHIAPTEIVVAATRTWIERAVIGLNLCPFAKAVYLKEQIRYVVSSAQTPDALIEDLDRELRFLVGSPPHVIDTTLLIHPKVLNDFLDFNDFIGVAEAAIGRLGLVGVAQLATFHPAYQFAGTQQHDISNYTNRSPYPMLQLLRESSMDRAVAAFPETEEIYRRNIATMRRLGVSGWDALSLAAPGKPIA
jgi:uncharacterized protein